MKTLRNRVCTARLFGPAIAVLLIAGTLGPVSAHGDHSVTTSGNAVIAFAQGDNVRLRSGPGYDTSEIDRYAEGTSVEVLDGPFADEDANQWYQVSVSGQTGYMVADYLATSSSFSSTSGQAVANDSVNVRAGASTSDAVVTTLAEGDVVTLTGSHHAGWISVSARGGDGWVFGDYLGAPSAPAPEQPGEPAEPAPEEPTGETRYALEQVNLRSGPGTEYPSTASLVVGVEMHLTGKVENGFASVTSGYGEGWVYAQYIGPVSPGAPVNPEPTTVPTEEPTEAPGETGTRYTIDTVHLRSGPSTGFDSITYLEVGVQLELTGELSNGFAEVTSDFGTGWVAAQYIGTDSPSNPDPTTTPDPTTEPTTTPDPTTEPEPTTTPDPTTEPEPQEPVSRWTTANVNLRSESSAAAGVITVITAGTELSFAGVATNGFSQVTSTAGTGWISSEFLSETRPDVPANPDPSGSLLTWPVRGGEWSILQGYNGSSHQNRSSSWQYYYSLDLVRSDGSTAGQPVYSPVGGTMRWIDEASGGGSIYMGDGLAFAFFHVVMDPSIQEGDTIAQGQYLGTIAPRGQLGAGSTPHLHITIWETSDGGNWSRIAVPFTGNVSLAGTEFPATSGGNQWRGFTFTP